ncbi:S-adenosylmethionine decarboxylase [Polaromonas sp.]|uniref:S-adenosylmethionine decarboxylase n=1 Tax=Polaromonas sp. TaxID=1869339 RepID=UPI003457FF77
MFFPLPCTAPAALPLPVLLAESHVCVHTRPEQPAVAFDVHVCNFGSDHCSKAKP